MRLRLILIAEVIFAALLGACGGGATSSRSPSPTPPNPPAPVITITTESLPGATAGVSYTQTLTAAGGTLPLKWTTNKLLPQGLSLSEDGVFGGTSPVSDGGMDVPIRFCATDSATPANSTCKTLFFNVFGLRGSAGFGRVGIDIWQNANFGAYGGTEPIQWSLSGNLPPGVALRRNTASPDTREYELAGVPTQAGVFAFSITVSDSGFPSRGERVDYQLEIQPPYLQLQKSLLPPAAVGQVYDYGFPLVGGAAPFVWSLYDGQLQEGLHFDAANGRISGTPITPGYASFIVSIADSSPQPQTGEVRFWLLVTPNQLPIRNDSIANATPIYPGYYSASISPYGNGTEPQDQDYYQLTLPAGTKISIVLGATARTFRNPTLDPVVEIVDANSHRFSSCNDRYDDHPPPGIPISVDTSPDGFDDPCMNRIGDPINPFPFSRLEFRVPGSSGIMTFYLHVFDYFGRARPDMTYDLNVTLLSP